MADDPQRRFEEDRALDARLDAKLAAGAHRHRALGRCTPDARPDDVTVAPDGRPMAEQPQWRQDFPIDWPQDQYVARRDFAKFLVLTSGAFVAGQAWIAAQHLVRIAVAAAAAQADRLADRRAGGRIAKMFDYPMRARPCLLIRIAGDTRGLQPGVHAPVLRGGARLRGGRTPGLPVPRGLLRSATGRNIAGPPPRPLPQIELEVVGDEVYAVGVNTRTV
jgi:Rieske Fe-S protein